MRAREVADRFGDAKEEAGGGYVVHCPGPNHQNGDRRASLAFTDAIDRVLGNCRSGNCDLGQVLSLKGLKMSDLFHETTRSTRKTRGRVVAEYRYEDENGGHLYDVVRRETPPGDPKDFTARSANGTPRTKGIRRVPYRLPQLVKAVEAGRAVFLVEGEKDAETLVQSGLVATCNPFGAGKWRAEYSECLRDATVYVLPDNDGAGRDHAADVVRQLAGIAKEIRVVELPNLPEKGDITDWMSSGGTVEALRELVRASPPISSYTAGIKGNKLPLTLNSLNSPVLSESGEQAEGEDADDDADDDAAPRKDVDQRAPKSARAVEYVTPLIKESFSTSSGETYIDVAPAEGETTQTLRVSSRETRALLDKVFYEQEASPLGGQPRKDALDVLDAKARHSGNVRAVHVRVAECDDAIYIDLGDPTWRAVRVTAEGWSIVDRVDVPVRFRRSRGMRPLPVPVTGGDIEKLKSFVPATGEAFILAVAWLLGTFRAKGPFVVLVIHGEQGSAKSTTARYMLSLIDPRDVPLRSPPRDERDLIIAALNAQVVALDNLSHVQPWMSDALCRLSTGGGLSTRELYTDDGEVTLSATRPLILTGIEDVATRGDLADRCYSVALQRITDENRLTERDLGRKFEEAAPGILGALLDVVAHGLKHEADVRDVPVPRMADAARWVLACEGRCPWEPGEYMKAYAGVREEMVLSGIAGDNVAQAVLNHLDRSDDEWTGTAGELLEALNTALDGKRPPKDWVGSARGMTARLTRIAPLLRGVGVDVDHLPREAGGNRRRLLTLRKVVHNRPNRPNRPDDLPNAIQDNDLEGRDGCSDRRDGLTGTVPTVPQSARRNSLQDNDLTDRDGWDGSDRTLSRRLSNGVQEPALELGGARRLVEDLI